MRKSSYLLRGLTRGRGAAWALSLLFTGSLAGPLAAPAVAQRAPGNRAATPAPPCQLLAVPTDARGARPTLADAQPTLRQALALRPQDELRPLRTETDERGDAHLRYQQYFRGVKVEHGVVTLHARGGELTTISGETYAPPAALSVRPALTEAAARQRALAAVGAKRYMWQDAAEEAGLRQRTNNPRATYFPTGELVLVADHRAATNSAPAPLALTWKFNVYARAPISREVLYVDARTGAVVLRDAVIKHVNAPATMATRYSGTKPGTTDNFGSGFRLRETARGKGVTTLNCQTGTSFAAAVDFIDNDNNWTAAEHDNSAFDNAALDAHLGAAATQEYWTTQHGRDSYDDRGTVLLSFVHFDLAYDNAFWDGTEMVYGDGGSRFSPLTSVDVCAHEVGHAVCETTANLVYANESGALNEAFSDIWGACVEYHFDPTKQIWLIGEDIDLVRPSLRSMSNPNAEDCPDTYQGNFWDPGQGVHTNSGVFNHWFYLLSVGGTGTNDNGTPFAVTGITIEKAAKIAYRSEWLYMTPNTDYRTAVRLTMQCAVDLYGLSSPEATAVANAWRAVGLGDPTPAFTSMSPTSGPVGTVVTINGVNLASAFRVTFNGTAATDATFTSGTQLTVAVPPGATTGPVVITTPSGAATSAGVFTVTVPGPVPAILSYSPAIGAPQGATVLITGTNLTGASAVTINGATATYTVNSATQITATVPATATSGPLRVTTPGGRATAPTPFLVLPFIAALNPTVGVVGTVVTITGTSFTGALDVKFNGVYATFTVVSATQVRATVPAGATTGPVTVRTPSGRATSPAPFTVTPTLAITSFTPVSGPPLVTIVTIYCLGFTGATEVKFNNAPATTYTVASDTELWATVPAGATTGPIRVTTPLGTVSSTTQFNVLIPGAPRIDDFTPPLGPVGTSVTITGLDFTGATSVQFNGTPATVVSNTATRIVTEVPVGATTGQISITTALGTGVSTTPFRVVVPPANDLCTSPNVPLLTCGSVVTGTNIGATTTGDPPLGSGCGTSVDNAGVFYRFVGTGRTTTVETCGGITDYDSKIHVFTGTCGNLTCVGGNDDACNGTATVVTFAATAGTPYLIFVSGYGSSTGDFTLTLTCGTPPPVVLAITDFTPTRGPIGTVVSVRGRRFTGLTSVRFNGANATTFAASTDSTLTATVPPGAATGPISVFTTTAFVTSTGIFTVERPVIISFSPASGPVGTAVQVRGRMFTGATGFFFAGVATSAVFTVVSDTVITTTVPGSAITGALRVVTPLGTAISFTAFVVTLPPPANDLCIAANLPVLTCGASLTGTTLGATTTGDPTTAQSCGTSIFSGGVFYRFIGTGGVATAATCGGPATFNTKLHVFSGTCGNLVCLGGNDDFCGASSSVSFPTTAGTPYLIFVSGFGGSSGNFTVGVSCAPLAPVITSFSPASGPVGTVVTLTGTTFSGVTAVRFGAVAAPGFTVNPAGTQLTVAVPAGAGYAPLSLVAGAGGPAVVSATSFCTQYTPVATAASRCGVGTVTLTATGTVAGGTYAWYAAATGGSPLAGGLGAAFVTPSLTTTTTYYVAAVTDVIGAGCVGPRVPVTATVGALPTVTLAPSGPTTFCSGGTVTLTAAGGATYLWSTGATTPSITVTTAGTYSVTGTAVGGCAAPALTQSVTVNPTPATPAVTSALQPTGVVVLTSSAPTGNQWYLNGVAITGATGATYTVGTAAQNGLYTVISTSGAGCASVTSPAQTVSVVGTANDLTAPALALWPNPAHGQVSLTGAPARTEAALYDATGRRVRAGQTDARGAATLDLTGLPAGVYAVRAGSSVRRLVVE